MLRIQLTCAPHFALRLEEVIWALEARFGKAMHGGIDLFSPVPDLAEVFAALGAGFTPGQTSGETLENLVCATWLQAAMVYIGDPSTHGRRVAGGGAAGAGGRGPDTPGAWVAMAMPNVPDAFIHGHVLVARHQNVAQPLTGNGRAGMHGQRWTHAQWVGAAMQRAPEVPDHRQFLDEGRMRRDHPWMRAMNTVLALPPGPCGAPVLQCSEWLLAELANGRDPADLFEEWERRNFAERGKKLKDARNSFTVAVYRGLARFREQRR